MVFSGFSHFDEGRGRRLVAVCERVEDASLIAAAPELLASLQEMLTFPSGQYSECGGYDAAEKRARAAILKATGEQP